MKTLKEFFGMEPVAFHFLAEGLTIHRMVYLFEKPPRSLPCCTVEENGGLWRFEVCPEHGQHLLNAVGGPVT